ncbi:phosphate ABC transporter substrate-binding protein, PhoT family [Thermodesulfobium acidiphilum]|uniref:Phosphate-binding protein n=1 Tax=Thermodesulfobium acidiphilum TaxID=1794699 RepID=A0A2R4VYD7_THEAF|nr:phosphate ABC transporter substrate-binding protein PstS [Thermodesulfobium acidiphilum]AWB09561.1 phosphate ABC transporter substrate-binding protein, PhoT family [Thermodesulfobium acidiphilum]
MKRILLSLLGVFLLVATVFYVAGCSSSNAPQSASQVKQLTGAGSTFVYPLFSKMFEEYKKEKGVEVNYQSIGSGGGINALKDGTTDFSASDAYMSEKEMQAVPGGVVTIADAAGAVSISYNIPGVNDLVLDGKAIADIYLGKIKDWNDPYLKKLNPGVNLPAKPIVVAHRSDGSGTTFIFTHYLSLISPDWKDTVGAGTSVKWPVGLGGKGSEGVTAIVKQNPYSIGYVELTYALQNNITTAKVKNKSGNIIAPTLESTKKAFEGVKLPSDMRALVLDTSNPEGYPITGFTFILLHKEMNYKGNTLARAKAVLNLVKWIITDGQKYCEPLDYVQLPKEAVDINMKNLESITWDGKPILTK